MGEGGGLGGVKLLRGPLRKRAKAYAVATDQSRWIGDAVGVSRLFYNNSNKWIQMMRKSIQTAVDFTAHRMIKEYHQKFYQSQQEEMLNSIK